MHYAYLQRVDFLRRRSDFEVQNENSSNLIYFLRFSAYSNASGDLGDIFKVGLV